MEGVAQFKTTKKIVQQSDEEVLAIVTKYEPFNHPMIAQRIMEIVENENA